jgi:hypothetical protein
LVGGRARGGVWVGIYLQRQILLEYGQILSGSKLKMHFNPSCVRLSVRQGNKIELACTCAHPLS